MKKIIREGEQLPKGYGVSYFLIDRLAFVAYPIPLNIVIAYIRKVWIALKAPDIQDLYVEVYQEAKTRGFGEGMKQGFTQGKNEALELEKKRSREILRTLEIMKREIDSFRQAGL